MEVWSSQHASRCQLGPAESHSELLEHSNEGPEEEEEEEEEEASLFTVRRYEQPACLLLGMDETHTHRKHTKQCSE